MRYLLDTNIISEQTKRVPDSNVMKRLELDSIFAVTAATVWHELWYGVHCYQEGERKQQLTSYLELLTEDGLVILPFCQDAAEWLAAERARLKRQGLIPTQYDSEIAAVAAVNNLILVTRNTDDFVMFDDLRVENWFSI
jgi:tRNA(fMet)-specific endonuclease VapC